MHDHIASNKQNQTQKSQKFSKTPKISQNPKNLGPMREMHEKWRIRSSYHKIEALLGQNLEENGDLSERVFGGREKNFYRERKERNEIWFHADP